MLMSMSSLFLPSYSVPSLLSLRHTLMYSFERRCLGYSELMTIQERVARELPALGLSLGVNNCLPNTGSCSRPSRSCPEETYKMSSGNTEYVYQK